jgi:hypothetical protein
MDQLQADGCAVEENVRPTLRYCEETIVDEAIFRKLVDGQIATLSRLTGIARNDDLIKELIHF